MTEQGGEFYRSSHGLEVPLVPYIENARIEIANYLTQQRVGVGTGLSETQVDFLTERLNQLNRDCPYRESEVFAESERLFIQKQDDSDENPALMICKGNLRGIFKCFNVIELQDVEGNAVVGLTAIVEGRFNFEGEQIDAYVYVPLEGDSIVTPFFPDQNN